jgi:hypothetical protein
MKILLVTNLLKRLARLKKIEEVHVEKILCKRLRIMALILALFAGAFFLYASTNSFAPPQTESPKQQLSSNDKHLGLTLDEIEDLIQSPLGEDPRSTLNFYIVATIFSSLAGLTFFLSFQRKN